MKLRNLSKLVKQNRLFLVAVVTLFIILLLVVYFAGTQIYDRETKLQYGNADTQMLSAVHGINTYFSHPMNDLSFLGNLPNTRDYVDSGFTAAHSRDEVRGIFYDLARINEHYCQVRIIDSSGQEIVRIYKKSDGITIIATESSLQDQQRQHYFQEAMKLDKGQFYVCPIDSTVEPGKADMSKVPALKLATPLFTSKGERRGILVLDTDLSGVLKLLPANMFIQTEEGNSISLKPDGAVDFKKSSYRFKDTEGELFISEVEAIHYSTVQFLPGQRLIVAVHHDHSLLKAELDMLTTTSILVLLFSFGLLLIIGYINLARGIKVIDAHRAIISSLGGLTERRDPDTGGHLDRSREYPVLVAKQLRHNKKYHKTITSEFIDDLYYAAPLHDIGKVGIRDSILLKQGKLNSEEFDEIKQHVRIGEKVLQDVIDEFKLKQSFLIIGKNICAYHHEQYNGKGYLEGLKGQEIPLEARIFALCDAYDAIRSRRPYKDEMPHEEAIKRIKSDSGEHFDPDIVDAFLRCEQEFLRISNTYL